MSKSTDENGVEVPAPEQTCQVVDCAAPLRGAHPKLCGVHLNRWRRSKEYEMALEVYDLLLDVWSRRKKPERKS